MRSFALLTVVASMMVACSSPAEDGAAESTSEAALSGGAVESRSQVLYRGELYFEHDAYTVELELNHPSVVRTTQTVRGSQIMTDSPWCDAFIDGIRAEMTLRVISMITGETVAQNSSETFINAQKQLDDSVCPLGIINRSDRRAVESLEAEPDLQGVSFTSMGKSQHVPFGYVGAGILAAPVKVSFEATGRGTFQGKRESDRGGSTFVVPGRARLQPVSTITIQAGDSDLNVPVVLTRRN